MKVVISKGNKVHAEHVRNLYLYVEIHLSESYYLYFIYFSTKILLDHIGCYKSKKFVLNVKIYCDCQV